MVILLSVKNDAYRRRWQASSGRRRPRRPRPRTSRKFSKIDVLGRSRPRPGPRPGRPRST